MTMDFQTDGIVGGTTIKRSRFKVAIMANSGVDHETGLDVQTLDDKYLTATIELCGALPIIVPTLLMFEEIDELLTVVDGVILTGDQSNVAPHRYGLSDCSDRLGPFDTQRDEAALYLALEAIKRGKPLFGICRGMQEINVALGGTLIAGFVGKPDFHDHPFIEKSNDPERIYANVHRLSVDATTSLGRAIGTTHVNVNSVHVQAVDKLGTGLRPVAMSSDGIVEAFESENNGMVIGVQWHPEYRATTSSISRAIFGRFAELMEMSRDK